MSQQNGVHQYDASRRRLFLMLTFFNCSEHTSQKILYMRLRTYLIAGKIEKVFYFLSEFNYLVNYDGLVTYISTFPNHDREYNLLIEAEKHEAENK